LLNRSGPFIRAPRELLIVGTGGLAKEAAQLARQCDPDATHWDKIHYVAESKEMVGAVLPYGVVRYIDADLECRSGECDVVIAIGYPRPRRHVSQRLARNPALAFPNLIHPSVFIDSKFVSLGRGNMIATGAVLTCDVTLGDFNLVNWNVTIGHDARLGSCNVLNPSSNLSGNTVVGDACLLGTGCQILEQLSVASDCTIGAGAVVTRSISVPGGTYVGIPARLFVR